MITSGVEGVDYAFPPRPSPAALVAAGKKFACRYGGPGTENKWIHADEAAQLTAAGIWIAANAEGSAAGLGGGWTVGVSWARSADAWFKSIGMPAGRPIYFSADFDVIADDWPAVADALRGAASVIGPARVGVYGSYNVMRWAARDSVAAWFWQTYAWSAGRWAPGNHVEQYRNGVTIDGADCDLNRAIAGDYGQWTIGGTPIEGTSEMTLFAQVKDNPEIYIGNGLQFRHLTGPGAPEAFAAAQAAGVATVVVVKNTDQLYALMGTLGDKTPATVVMTPEQITQLGAEIAQGVLEPMAGAAEAAAGSLREAATPPGEVNPV